MSKNPRLSGSPKTYPELILEGRTDKAIPRGRRPCVSLTTNCSRLPSPTTNGFSPYTSRAKTRCRISGGSIVDYASDSAVPSQLYAQTGTDLTGQCWYYTSA